LVRVTVAAAIAAGRQVGLGNEVRADNVASDAMRRLMKSLPMRGVIVLADVGGDFGNVFLPGDIVGDGTGPDVDVAVDPIDGVRLVARGMPNAIAVLAVAERGTMPDKLSAVTYMSKLSVGRDAADVVDISQPVGVNLSRLAERRQCQVEDLTVCILDRERNEGLVGEVRASGARIRFISDGDIAGALAVAREDSNVHMLIGVGRTPECIIAACGLKCLGGSIQAKLAPRDDAERDRALASGLDLNRVYHTDDLAGKNVFFAATGITSGDLLREVRYGRGGANTQSIVMRERSGTIRTIDSFHPLTG
jgi:fructose-1,6-bisphosphatase II